MRTATLCLLCIALLSACQDPTATGFCRFCSPLWVWVDAPIVDASDAPVAGATVWMRGVLDAGVVGSSFDLLRAASPQVTDGGGRMLTLVSTSVDSRQDELNLRVLGAVRPAGGTDTILVEVGRAKFRAELAAAETLRTVIRLP